MPASPAAGMSLRDIFRIAFRHQKKFVVFFIATLGLVGIATLLASKVYHSEGKLFVRIGRENIGLDATATLGEAAVVTLPSSRENEINSVVELLRSRALSATVVDAIGPEEILGPDASLLDAAMAQVQRLQRLLTTADDGATAAPTLTPRDRAIRHFEENRGVWAVDKSNIIGVSYETRNPALAQRVLDTLIDEYLIAHVRVHRSPGAHEFLAEQTDRLRAQLTTKEDQLHALKQQTGIASPIEQQQILVARIGRLEDELLQTETTLESTLAEAQGLRASMQGVARLQVIGRTTGLDNVAADAVRQQLYDLQMQEQALMSRFTSAHPDAQQIRRQIQSVQSMLGGDAAPRATAQPSPRPAQHHADLIASEPLLASLDAKAQQLRSHLATAREQLEQFNEHELQIARLEREIAVQDAGYRKYVENLEQATLDQSLEAEQISNISVFEPATYVPKPVFPRKLLNLVLGFGFALFGGVALMLLAEYLDQSLKTAEEVEARLGTPTLATIPRLGRKQLVLNGKH